MEHQDHKRQPKGNLVPEDNKLQISNKKDVNFFIFLAKIFLKKYPDIELHALGEAISSSVRVAENLERFGFVKIEKIEVFTHTFEQEKNSDRVGGKKVKMIVKLKRSADFDKKTENIKQ